MKLDSRQFSKEAYDGLTALIEELTPLANRVVGLRSGLTNKCLNPLQKKSKRNKSKS